MKHLVTMTLAIALWGGKVCAAEKPVNICTKAGSDSNPVKSTPIP